MSAVDDVRDELAGALRATVLDDGHPVRVYTDPGEVVSPPAAVLGPPALQWEGYVPEPTAATFPCALVVSADTRAAERLADMVTRVAASLHDSPSVGQFAASPDTWPVGASDLPAYLLEIEVSL